MIVEPQDGTGGGVAEPYTTTGVRGAAVTGDTCLTPFGLKLMEGQLCY